MIINVSISFQVRTLLHVKYRILCGAQKGKYYTQSSLPKCRCTTINFFLYFHSEKQNTFGYNTTSYCVGFLSKINRFLISRNIMFSRLVSHFQFSICVDICVRYIIVTHTMIPLSNWFKYFYVYHGFTLHQKSKLCICLFFFEFFFYF